MPDNPISLPDVTKDQVLFYITVYEFPNSTLRHQVFVEGHLVEKVTTFANWIELEARRIGSRTNMKFGRVCNDQRQVALVAIRT